MATAEINRNFASAIGADGLPVYAPAYIMVGGRLKLHPTAEDYAAHTPPCYPVEDKRPENPAPSGYHYEAQGYVLDAEASRIRRVYALVADPPPTLADYDAAMEAHLREEREARGYTTREPDCYLTSQVPRWAQDARDWVAHRDAVMGYALNLINAVEAGTRTPPTMAEFTAGLPRIEWTFTEGAQ